VDELALRDRRPDHCDALAIQFVRAVNVREGIEDTHMRLLVVSG